MNRFSLALLCSFLGASGAQAQPIELTVSAAASLQDALREIGRDYQMTTRATTVNFNFGSSGALQKQIEQGAPVDVFISAADKNLDELASQKLIETPSRRLVASNSLVLVVPRNSKLPIRRFKDLSSNTIKNVAMGGPSVPAGMRAQEVLSKLGIWTRVQGKAIRAKDVRAALTQVELGNVDAGIVYRSDAASSKKVRVLAIAPFTMHKPIRYLAAVVAGSASKASARDFVRYLGTAKAKNVLRKYRFVVR